MQISIEFLKEAEDFLDSLDSKVKKKILMDVNKTCIGIRGEWFRKMQGTDDIWEFRTFFNKTYYRMFAFWFREEGKNTLIVCTHGLVKTTDKTPKGDIERAERLKKEYLEKD